MTHVEYVLDANVFIEAKKRYYAFDLVPRFWECLEEQASCGRVRSIDRVRDELEKGNDELKEWALEQHCQMFASTDDPPIIETFRGIMAWVQSQSQFTDAAKAQFASCADGWLIAYARVHGLTVVTHESFSADVKIKVKIPNVCRTFDVEYVDTFAMLRGLGVTL